MSAACDQRLVQRVAVQAGERGHLAFGLIHRLHRITPIKFHQPKLSLFLMLHPSAMNFNHLGW